MAAVARSGSAVLFHGINRALESLLDSYLGSSLEGKLSRLVLLSSSPLDPDDTPAQSKRRLSGFDWRDDASGGGNRASSTILHSLTAQQGEPESAIPGLVLSTVAVARRVAFDFSPSSI